MQKNHFLLLKKFKKYPKCKYQISELPYSPVCREPRLTSGQAEGQQLKAAEPVLDVNKDQLTEEVNNRQLQQQQLTRQAATKPVPGVNRQLITAGVKVDL